MIEAFSVSQKEDGGPALISVRHARHCKEDLTATSGTWTKESIIQLITGWIQGDAVTFPTKHRATVRLVQEILKLNSRLLSKAFKKKVEQEGCGAQGAPGAGMFKASFITRMKPVPPASRVLAPLCTYCKKERGRSNCSECKTPYCSKAYQTKDYKDHKNKCATLKASASGGPSSSSALSPGGSSPPPPQAISLDPQSFSSSVTIDMSNMPDSLRGMHTAMMSNQGQGVTYVNTDVAGGGASHANSRPFVIKVQLPMMGRGPIMIYDQKRTFQTFVGTEQLGAYEALIVAARRGGLNVPKVYLNAKREGESLLIVDTNPPVNQSQFRW